MIVATTSELISLTNFVLVVSPVPSLLCNYMTKLILFALPHFKPAQKGLQRKNYLACPSKVLCVSKDRRRVDIVHRYHELCDYDLDSGSILTTYTPT